MALKQFQQKSLGVIGALHCIKLSAYSSCYSCHFSSLKQRWDRMWLRARRNSLGYGQMSVIHCAVPGFTVGCFYGRVMLASVQLGAKDANAICRMRQCLPVYSVSGGNKLLQTNMWCLCWRGQMRRMLQHCTIIRGHVIPLHTSDLNQLQTSIFCF